jgi:integral membrane protein (TIGR01906 family)
MKARNLLFSLLLLLTPLLIITSGMRVALSPVFYTIEYRLPNFPPDSYGFTQADRLRWAEFSIDFISGKIDTATFAGAQLPDGSPLFNEREIAHMVDVRILTIAMLWVWRFLVITFLLAFVFTKSKNAEGHFLQMLAQGAKVTLFLIAAILIFLAINFNQLFTAFHRIFFEGDSWLFYLNDSLIRLFPLKFWQDLFIFIGALSILLSLALIYVNHKRLKSAARD